MTAAVILMVAWFNAGQLEVRTTPMASLGLCRDAGRAFVGASLTSDPVEFGAAQPLRYWICVTLPAVGTDL